MELKEEWKDVLGFEGFYQISNMGRVKRLDRMVYTNHPKHPIGLKMFVRGLVLKCGVGSTGYPVCMLFKSGAYKSFKVHRLVAMHFIPNPDNKAQVNHKDCNKTNNCVSNLEWNTLQENVAHYVSKGFPSTQRRITVTQRKGHKLNPEDVKEIRELDGTMGLKAIGRKYNIHRTTVRRILKGVAWAKPLAVDNTPFTN